ncbi:hypothetical protein EKI60_03795 [Candidatus Saccharibacteria bacterium]|nr:MAG: hypothetical protein EKI60_03795 [Candidatus Saccharibacteria bacterium]
MSSLLTTLAKDFPNIAMVSSDSFYWSPRKKTVFYIDEKLSDTVGEWSLLHEIGHALLEHQTYQTDFNLLQLEVMAWDKAQELAKKYKVVIDPDHIQDCLDTYRDWLYQRSTCPTCTSCSLQIDSSTYRCFNCNTEWRVSRSRKCRTYRKKQTAKLPVMV